MTDPTSRLNAALEGRYSIERELGEGGMATVYLAADLKHERKVALKVLKPELAAVVGAERFLAEIKTTANLSHPHILPLHDSGEADSFLFYVMPYVEGETLRDKLDRDHQLTVDEAVRIATNIAEALAYAHSHGVIHRDIKPANILLQAGKPVISDFGLALAVGTAGQGRLTETGLSMGTPHYMSPEQATGDLSVGAATDVYALGCVLYEMLVGEPPYTGSTAQAILGKIIAGDLASAAKQRASVPTNVDAAIEGYSLMPFFSPDGDWLGFFDASVDGSSAALTRLSTVDGSVETIAQATFNPAGVTWGDDGTIVASASRTDSLYQVAATGGDWPLLFAPDLASGERFYQSHMLPGSETLLFHVARSYDPELAEIVALDLATKTRKTVLTERHGPLDVQTGHLLFMRQGTLMAVGFDLERVEVQGQAVTVVDDVMHSVYRHNGVVETGAGQVAVSAAGHLAYVLGGISPERPRLVMHVTPTGDAEALDMDPREYGRVRGSPDGARLAFEVRHGQKSEIWVRDLGRGVARRLNTGGFVNNLGEWSPDGRSLAFSSDREGGVVNLYRMAVDGSGEPERLAPSAQVQSVMSWSSEGVIAYAQSGDLWALPPDGEPTRLFASEVGERWATFSPDGRWLACVSRQSGRMKSTSGPTQARTRLSRSRAAAAWVLHGRTTAASSTSFSQGGRASHDGGGCGPRGPVRGGSRRATHRSLALRHVHSVEGLRYALGRLIRRPRAG